MAGTVLAPYQRESESYKESVIHIMKIHGLCNSTRRIATLEDKAAVGGLRLVLPQEYDTSLVPTRNVRSGKFMHYSRVERVDIPDVDGITKPTIMKSYFNEDMSPHKNKPSFGVFDKNLAWRYHGVRSRNWKSVLVTPDEIVQILDNGYSFAPGLFDAPRNESARSAQYLKHYQVILFDGDEFGVVDPTDDYNELLRWYPDIVNDFYWVGESISSRSWRDPNLRLRLMLVLPQPILKEDDSLIEVIVNHYTDKYPFIAKSVANDKVRLSYGNARNECISQKYGNVVSDTQLEQWKADAEVLTAHKAEQAEQQQQQQEQQRQQRQQRETVRQKLKDRGHTLNDNHVDPFEAFYDTDLDTLLREIGCSPAHRNNWMFPGTTSNTQKDFTKEPGSTRIVMWAHSMIDASPVDGGSGTGINGHRFVAYYNYGLDITKDADKPELRRKLYADGYGTDPAKWLEDHRKERRLAQQEGLIPSLQPSPAVTIEPPEVVVRDVPSYPHFSNEERQVIEGVLGKDPDAGWNGKVPAWVTQYGNLHRVTNEEHFALNGQPESIMKHRRWSTDFQHCDECNSPIADWVDVFRLTAGAYCAKCHADKYKGSYLELELIRKPENAQISTYENYLADDALFKDFELFEPGWITHLGAAMGTGKTTVMHQIISNKIRNKPRLRAIFATPRITLAKSVKHLFSGRDGPRSWGLYHEGSDDKSIGRIGAVCCMPSIPRVIEDMLEEDIDPRNILIAVDEIDYGYSLLKFVSEMEIGAKDALRTAVEHNGLCVSGQTAYTLSLESMKEEFGADNIKAFYKPATATDEEVTINNYTNESATDNDILCGMINSVKERLANGKNVYAFVSSRRDANILEQEFKDANPVLLTSKRHGDHRGRTLLHNQRLPSDSSLMVATSTGGVGLSINDPDGETVIGNTLTYGSRDMPMAVQKGIRNRNRRNIEYHIKDYNFTLPVSATEATEVSIYHEKIKEHGINNQHSTEHIASVYALNCLSDLQPETFFRYHFEDVASMKVNFIDTEWLATKEDIDHVVTVRKELRDEENEQRKIHAQSLIDTQEIPTHYETRIASKRGEIGTIEQLGRETATDAYIAIGWDGKKPPREKGEDDEQYEAKCKDAFMQLQLNHETASRLIDDDIDFDSLRKRRAGYCAVHFLPEMLKWELTKYDDDVETTAHDELVFKHHILKNLIIRLDEIGFVDESTLASELRDFYKSKYSEHSYIEEIHKGALGLRLYRSSRYMMNHDEIIIEWTRNFVSENYLCRIRKSDGLYGLIMAPDIGIVIHSICDWLIQKEFRINPEEMPLECSQSSTPREDRITSAQTMYADGEPINTILQSTGFNNRQLRRYITDIPESTRITAVNERIRTLLLDDYTIDQIYAMGYKKNQTRKIKRAIEDEQNHALHETILKLHANGMKAKQIHTEIDGKLTLRHIHRVLKMDIERTKAPSDTLV